MTRRREQMEYSGAITGRWTFPAGPSLEQIARDRNCTAISTLTTMLATRRTMLNVKTLETARWTEAERDAHHRRCLCEIEALETALVTLQHIETTQVVLVEYPPSGENTF